MFWVEILYSLTVMLVIYKDMGLENKSYVSYGMRVFLNLVREGGCTISK